LAQDARYFLSGLFAMRAVAKAGGDADPPMPAEWRQFRRDVGLVAGSEDFWGDDATWRSHVEAARGYCHEHGMTARQAAKSWESHERVARDYVATVRDRNERRLSAACTIRNALMDDSGPGLFGRHAKTGGFDEIPRATLIDPRSSLRTDPAANLYQNQVRFLNELHAPGGGYDLLSFSTRAIIALSASRRPPGCYGAPVPKRARPAVEAAKAAALHLFPDGPPMEMPSKVVIGKIHDEVKRRGACAKDRSVRTAISTLRAVGLWPSRV